MGNNHCNLQQAVKVNTTTMANSLIMRNTWANRTRQKQSQLQADPLLPHPPPTRCRPDTNWNVSFAWIEKLVTFWCWCFFARKVLSPNIRLVKNLPFLYKTVTFIELFWQNISSQTYINNCSFLSWKGIMIFSKMILDYVFVCVPIISVSLCKSVCLIAYFNHQHI